MPGNLDKILKEMSERTSAEIKKAEKHSHEKQERLMKCRPFLQ